MQECRNYCMCATLADYRCDTSLTRQLSPLNGNYLINTSWMLTAAAHIGKELSWLMAICHTNGLSLSCGPASVGRSALHRSFWSPTDFHPLPDDLLAWAQEEKVIAERGFHFFTTSQLCFSSLLLLVVLHRDGVFWNVPSKWRWRLR